MVVRRRRKYRKKLGSRSYHGDTKNRRGKGIKGGRGRAGAWDHKKSSFRHELHGERGFKPPRKREERPINLDQVSALAEKHGLQEVDVTAFGYTKVLGRGKLRKPLTVVAPAFSARAKEKIEEAGGQAVIK